MRSRRIVVGAAAVALFALAAVLRLHHFDALPVHRDWAWFLRAAGAHAGARPPDSQYAFLYTSVPVVWFGGLLRLLGLQGALATWGLFAALAAPATAWAVRRTGASWAAAAGAGLVIALSPTDIAFGRGLESPYLATLLVAAGAVGWTALGRRGGAALLVGSWTLAAGMHVGLVGLAATAVVAVAWRGARIHERDGRAASLKYLGVALPAALPAVWIVLRFDTTRLLSNLLLLTEGAGQGYAGDPTTLRAVAESFGWTPGAGLVGILLLGAGAAAGPRTAAVVPSAGPALAAGAAPYLVGWARTGYLSDDHSAALLPLVLVTALPLARRAAEPVTALALASVLWLLVPRMTPTTVAGPPFAVALEVAEAIEAAVPAPREPVVLMARALERGTPPALSADVLGEMARVVGPPRGEGPATCVLVVPQRRAGLLGLDRVPAPTLRAAYDADVFVDPGCAVTSTQAGLLCASIPSGFFERASPRGVPARRSFAEVPGSCAAPVGVSLASERGPD